MAGRLYKFDNMKAVLIFLVVFGHFLELTKGHGLLYLVIYSFHIPLFIFVSGYFARFDRKTILLRLVCPYIIFQILYIFFEKYVLGNGKIVLTFLRPRWLLWYLFAMAVYYLLIPFFDVYGGKKKLAALSGMVIVALLSGYDGRAGYDFSAARILSFMPFFFAGYYAATGKNLAAFIGRKSRASYFIGIAFSLALVIFMVWVLGLGIISKKMLYGAYSYEAAGYGLPLRLLIFAFASVWIVIFLLIVPDRRLPVISHVGQCTMPVYILHGFVVELVGRHYAAQGGKLPIIYALLMGAAVVLVLGNRHVKRAFDMLFTGAWIEK